MFIGILEGILYDSIKYFQRIFKQQFNFSCQNSIKELGEFLVGIFYPAKLHCLLSNCTEPTWGWFTDVGWEALTELVEIAEIMLIWVSYIRLEFICEIFQN